MQNPYAAQPYCCTEATICILQIVTYLAMEKGTKPKEGQGYLHDACTTAAVVGEKHATIKKSNVQ